MNKQLKMVRLRLGISDGTYTELLGNELEPTTELVTALTIGNEQNLATGGRSPLMGPQRPGPPGGFRGGGPER